MTISVEVYEDAGPLLSGKGTYRNSVNNIGYKNSMAPENSIPYPSAPIGRPLTDTLSYSYPKYNFLKWSGTYNKASRPRILITNHINSVVDGYTCTTDYVKLFYKLTNVYDPGDTNIDGSLIYIPTGGSVVLYPRISTTGPEAATNYLQWMNGNTTYYTEYLVTKLHLEQGTQYDFGNLGALSIKFYLDEYEEAIL